jgi:hypothetical protein
MIVVIDISRCALLVGLPLGVVRCWELRAAIRLNNVEGRLIPKPAIFDWVTGFRARHRSAAIRAGPTPFS